MKYSEEVLEAISLVNSYGGVKSASYFMYAGYDHAEQLKLLKAIRLLRSIRYEDLLLNLIRDKFESNPDVKANLKHCVFNYVIKDYVNRAGLITKERSEAVDFVSRFWKEFHNSLIDRG